MLIEQQRYPIESAAKYNFPEIPGNTIDLPHGMSEICLFSMRELQKQVFPQDAFENVDISSPSKTFDGSFQASHFQPSFDETFIVGADVSSIKLGETAQGSLLAVRGAVVWNMGRMYRYLRLGPFLFHLTEDNKGQIFRLLSQYQNNLPIETVPADLFHLQLRLASILERWIQLNLCSTCSDGLVLIDGSLTVRNSDTSESIVADLLRVARCRGNVVLAFSKSSHIRFDGRSLTEIADKENAPCLVKVSGVLESAKDLKLLGDVYVAKFSDNAICFRLDADKYLPLSRVLDAIQRLAGNDLFNHGQGYPETLRLAHIYSTFTANEVIGMQRYLEQERGLKIIIKPNLRRLLFGPFGKGQEE